MSCVTRRSPADVVSLVALGTEAFVVTVNDLAFRIDKVQAIGWFGVFVKKMCRAKDQPQVKLPGRFPQPGCLLPEGLPVVVLQRRQVDPGITGQASLRGMQQMSSGLGGLLHK